MGIAGANLSASDTAAQAGLGDRYEVGGDAWVYVQANGAIAQYDCVKIDDDYQAAKITYALTGSNAEPGKAGIAQFAFADDEYGWVFVKGGGLGRGIKVTVLASCAADVKLYTTATAGSLDDTSTTQALMQGLKLVTANGGSAAAVECFAADDIVFAS